ncbi:hypothetical protein [Amycolatopsis vastitatis]|uniref:Uncharacterized protein n=1 Tax=Amycolatopsis vastitatis TaxID=1905142 RepID=A0A229TEB4_9PSEU|nr:hypothetical protein [Amycolatopsis vastitatis]OXM69595.1 hypothetical protein CF165_08790 [Amycolatopsis vastitatis]
MSNSTLLDSPWQMWARTYVLLLVRLRKPRGVRLLLDDGRSVPCRCRFEGVADSGEVIWSARPETGERVPAAHLDSVEVDDMPTGAVIHLGAKLAGWRCPSCGTLTYDPTSAREASCCVCRPNGMP